MEKFLALASDILEVDPEEISLETAYGAFESWDSLRMMRLIMEIEAEYDVVIPIEHAAKIKTLNDLYQYSQS